jgi:hypothetical protein
MKISINTPSMYRQDIVHRIGLECWYHSLCDLGHSVYIHFDTPVLQEGALNIIMNPQLLINHHPEKVRQIIESNEKYIIVETEPLNPDGRTYGLGDMPERVYTENGINLYRGLLGQALFTAHFLIEPIEAIKLHTDKVEYMPILYNPSLEKIRHSREKQFDVLFFGSTGSESRRLTLGQLQKSGLKCVILGFCDYLTRDAYIANTRMVLEIPHAWQGYPYSYVSPYRMPYLAANKIAALTSRVRDHEGLLKLCHVATVPDLVEACHIYLASGNIAAEGERVYETYKSLPSMATWWRTIFDKYL